jgi:tetratricopeptide (TPR) repeat protein
MFSDLEVLRSVAPDSDIVTEIIADLHRRLGQWDHARAIYTELSQDPERESRFTATAYANIGVYFHRRGEYENAVNYFRRAAEADPSLAEAFFNLSQAYAQLYDFNQQHEAMAMAKELAGDAVEVWNDADVTAEESAIEVDGGLRRVEELREELAQLWKRRARPLDMLELGRRYRALVVAFAAIALALILHLLRKQMGLARSERLSNRPGGLSENRWVQALVPGLVSIREGRGLLAFLGILLPSAILMISLLRGLGYRVPLATDPGQWLALGFTLVALALVYLLRVGLVISN